MTKQIKMIKTRFNKLINKKILQTNKFIGSHYFNVKSNYPVE